MTTIQSLNAAVTNAFPTATPQEQGRAMAAMLMALDANTLDMPENPSLDDCILPGGDARYL